MDVVVVVGAGLDVHKKRIAACCIDGRNSPPKIIMSTFGTFLDELERLRTWLIDHQCTPASYRVASHSRSRTATSPVRDVHRTENCAIRRAH